MPRVNGTRKRSTSGRAKRHEEFRLDDLDGLTRFLDSHLENRRTQEDAAELFGFDRQLADRGRIFCGTCQRPMRMHVLILRPPRIDVRQEMQDLGQGVKLPKLLWFVGTRRMAPCLFQYQCVECEAQYTALVYTSPDGPRLMILPERHGGLATENTPTTVRYYLDQGERAEMVAAWSAAVPMYRSALEHLLFDAGYRAENLADKIAALDADHKSGHGLEWVRSLDEPYMTAVRKLGNAALYTNQGDISKQAELDEELLRGVKELFAALLDRVYERPARERAQLSALQSKVAAFPVPARQPKSTKKTT